MTSGPRTFALALAAVAVSCAAIRAVGQYAANAAERAWEVAVRRFRR